MNRDSGSTYVTLVLSPSDIKYRVKVNHTMIEEICCICDVRGKALK